jgi:hypothetical protein
VALGHPSGLEGLLRQCEHGGAVVHQALGLGPRLPTHTAEQVGITTSCEVIIWVRLFWSDIPGGRL